VLTHYRTRKLIGAYLDGALPGAEARTTEAHLVACTRCRRDADELVRLRALVRAVRVSPEVGPDWTGFWPGVVRRIEEGRRRAPVDIRWRWPLGVWRPRLAYGGALAGAILLTLGVWSYYGPTPAPEADVVVRSAGTELPGATVMVYSPPEKDLAVVWLFGEE